MRRLFGRLFNCTDTSPIERFESVVQEIKAFEADVKTQRDNDLAAMIAGMRQDLASQTAFLRGQLEAVRRQITPANDETRLRLHNQLEPSQAQLLQTEHALLDQILPKVFACVREASRRALGLTHFDIQLIGGILLHQGQIIEMQTGEGKTLAATLPAVLNALLGHGMHVVTANDYLARRDCQWIGPIFHLLGLRVAVIQGLADEGIDLASFQFNPGYAGSNDRYLTLEPITRKAAYNCDITYGTSSEFGFDYLRDNMVDDLSKVSQRELHYAIIDEADNLLIDEARTPLRIAGQTGESSRWYTDFARLVPLLKRSTDQSAVSKQPDGDYVADEKRRSVFLTDRGIQQVERALHGQNIYAPENAHLLPYLDNALRAYALFKRDVDYIVQHGRVLIIDEFTGRTLPGRRWDEGLHQAIEAKEGVPIEKENLTLATITIQSFFTKYQKLAGMTGTAATDAREFRAVYGLDVLVLPTNIEYLARQGLLLKRVHRVDGVEVATYHRQDGARFFKRVDYPDRVYRHAQAKFKSIVAEIEQLHQQERPVLVGTMSVGTSEFLSSLLKRINVPHEVLNSKNHEREAAIIAQAGRSGAVTIATNLAGRGVDILLGGNPVGLAQEDLRSQGVSLVDLDPVSWAKSLQQWQTAVAVDREKVVALGGLHVIGTERHAARRIDNQLRGRAGRQGDPGSSRFYAALDDDLMRRFGGEQSKRMWSRVRLDQDAPIEGQLINKSIEHAQELLEGYHFDIRQYLLKFDRVLNLQRELTYGERRSLLSRPSLKEEIQDLITQSMRRLVREHTTSADPFDWDLASLFREVNIILPQPSRDVTLAAWKKLDRERIEEHILRQATLKYAAMEQELGIEHLRQLEKALMLKTLDRWWLRHLMALEALREGIDLRAYGQQDPLVSFELEAFEQLKQLHAEVQAEFIRHFFLLAVVADRVAPA